MPNNSGRMINDESIYKQSMYDALWAIANMQIQEDTDKGEVLALCMAIARLELEKCSTDRK